MIFYKGEGSNMKKKILMVFILIIFIFIGSNISTGTNSITYLYLDAIKIEDSNIEMVSNEILIDTTTSKIENTINRNQKICYIRIFLFKQFFKL